MDLVICLEILAVTGHIMGHTFTLVLRYLIDPVRRKLGYLLICESLGRNYRPVINP